MEEKKHTQGKWEVYGSMVVIRNKEGFKPTKEHPIFVIAQCRCYTSTTWDESVLNAELIASAPDLLAENTRLKEVNQEILEMLGAIRRTAQSSGDNDYLMSVLHTIQRLAREAIQFAEEKK
jgi:hypothetical protein